MDKSNRIFARTAMRSALQFAPRSEVHPPVVDRGGGGSPDPPRRAADLGKQLDRMLVQRFAPPGVLINDELEILQFRGETGAYLEHPPGEPQTNLLKMARGRLASELRAGIAQARKKNAPAKREDVAVERDGIERHCDIEVIPLTRLRDSSERLFVVLFEEVGRSSRARPAGRKRAGETGEVARLERELAATRDYLQVVIDDHREVDEDLNAANEELISSNEELQSMNEELETAKEELQSTNEELTTVNEELHSRNHEITVINSDLVNLIAMVDVPILILDMERRIRRFTPKARSILKLVPSDVGRPLDDIKVNIAVPDLDRQITEVIEMNVMRESEVQDEEGRWQRMQIRPYKTIDHKIDGATLSLVDIDDLKHLLTEAEQMRRAAERANRAKDQFLAILSHELRTPLSAVLMTAQLLRREGMDAKIVRAGEVIERGARMQVKLIDDLLDVSRIIAGKLKMDLQAVDLCAVVKASIEGMSAPAERKSIQLDSLLDEAVGQVSGDPTRLQQIVSNLLTNAIKFTPAGGRVSVMLGVVDGRARITVTDTGVGIDSAFLPQVFDRFAQEDASNTRSNAGLGLGLAIVRHLVEAHGGTVSAESAGTGRGATFSVALPLLATFGDALESEAGSSGGAAGSPQPLEASERARLNDLRVLVVDDDPATREVVSEMLGRTGAMVRVAVSAASAMEVVETFGPQVILCDIAMPGEDGYSFIRGLRARGSARGGDIPALALTALAGEEDRLRARAAGFQMHLAKPVDITRLMQAVVELSRNVRPSPWRRDGDEDAARAPDLTVRSVAAQRPA